MAYNTIFLFKGKEKKKPWRTEVNIYIIIKLNYKILLYFNNFKKFVLFLKISSVP